MYRCQVRREHQSVVVRVRHDERTHQARGHAPRGSPYVLVLVLFREELHIKRFGEVLSEEVARAGLQRLAVLHHRLDAVGVECARKTLVGRLHALHHRYRHDIFGEVGIYIEHLPCEVLRFLLGRMSGMPLLPKELGGTQEQARAHLPAHHIAPLIAQDRQVSVTGNPVLVGGPDNGLRGRSDNQLLLQPRIGVHDNTLACGVVFQTVVRNHGALFRKALHMLRLTAQERLRDEQGEIGVLHAFRLETLVEVRLNGFPYRIAVGLDNHATAHRGLLCKVCFYYQFVVPLRVVFATRGQFLKICHILSWSFLNYRNTQSTLDTPITLNSFIYRRTYAFLSRSKPSGCAFSSSVIRCNHPGALSPKRACKVTAFLSIMQAFR